MVDLDDIRGWATAFPEVEETTHFRQPSFTVRGKPFVGIMPGGRHAGLSVDQAEAASLVAAAPEVYQEVWRNGRIFVGLQVDLAAASRDALRELIEHAWRHKAPKRLLAEYYRSG